MPIASSYFLLSFYFRKVVRGISRNQLKIYMICFYEETKTELGGELQGGPQGPDAPMGPPVPRMGPTWLAPSSTRAALSPINRLRPENPKYPIIFSRKHPRPPPSSTLDRESSEALPSTLSEGGIITGGIYITM